MDSCILLVVLWEMFAFSGEVTVISRQISHQKKERNKHINNNSGYMTNKILHNVLEHGGGPR